MDELGRPRWDGAAGRIEVWYATLTDGSTGDGAWVHYETVAPEHGEVFGHGWIALFPVDGSPRVERFGPAPLEHGRAGDADPWFAAGGAAIGPGRMTGTAAGIEWDLSFDDTSAPIYTFSKAMWERELLPGAQMVPWPSARVRGAIRRGGEHQPIDGTGAVARIYGHGNAQRWGWLHAELGGGDVLEIVSAVGRRPGMRRLPPAAMVQLRLAGEDDWPSNPLHAIGRLRTRLALPRWSVRGKLGDRRITVEVDQPDDRCVALRYTDPDGATATCTNTERADLTVLLERKERGRWVEHRRWELAGTAHAEVGLRS